VFDPEHYVPPWIIHLIETTIVRDKSALMALQRAAVAIEQGANLATFLHRHYRQPPDPHIIDRWLSEPNSAKTALIDAVCAEAPATSTADLVHRCLVLHATQLFLAASAAIFVEQHA